MCICWNIKEIIEAKCTVEQLKLLRVYSYISNFVFLTEHLFWYFFFLMYLLSALFVSMIENSHSILGAIAKLRKVPVSSITSVRMFVHSSAWNKSAPTGRILMKFDIWVFFENASSVHRNLTRLTGINSVLQKFYKFCLVTATVNHTGSHTSNKTALYYTLF